MVVDGARRSGRPRCGAGPAGASPRPNDPQRRSRSHQALVADERRGGPDRRDLLGRPHLRRCRYAGLVQVVPDESRLGTRHRADGAVRGRGRNPSPDYALDNAASFNTSTRSARLASIHRPRRGAAGMQVPYRINSRMSGNTAQAGRDLTHVLPPQSVRVTSIVPDDAADIRDTTDVMVSPASDTELARRGPRHRGHHVDRARSADERAGTRRTHPPDAPAAGWRSAARSAAVTLLAVRELRGRSTRAGTSGLDPRVGDNPVGLAAPPASRRPKSRLGIGASPTGSGWTWTPSRRRPDSS